MTRRKMTSWDDYWKAFDSLIDKLQQGGQTQIVKELKGIQKYVNGMTDGWFDFKTGMQKTLELNKNEMTDEQVDILTDLITALQEALNRQE
jgi:hypothetical protein